MSRVGKQEKNGKREEGKEGRKEEGGTFPLPFPSSFRVRLRPAFGRSSVSVLGFIRPFGFVSVSTLWPCVVSVSVRVRYLQGKVVSVSFPFPSTRQGKEHKDTRHDTRQKQSHGGLPVSFRSDTDEGGGEGGHPSFVNSQFLRGSGYATFHPSFLLSFPRGYTLFRPLSFLVFRLSFPHSFTRGLLSCLQQRGPRVVSGTFLFPYCIYYGVFCETIFRS